jgi:hypothetical protein
MDRCGIIAELSTRFHRNLGIGGRRCELLLLCAGIDQPVSRLRTNPRFDEDKDAASLALEGFGRYNTRGCVAMCVFLADGGLYERDVLGLLSSKFRENTLNLPWSLAGMFFAATSKDLSVFDAAQV